MKAFVCQTTGNYNEILEINSLEDIIKIMQRFNESVVVSFPDEIDEKIHHGCNLIIEIYNDWRE